MPLGCLSKMVISTSRTLPLVAGVTAQPEEPVREDTALYVVVEFPLHIDLLYLSA